MKSTDSRLVSKQMTHNICFILLAVGKENNNDPLKIWGLYLFVLAFPGECVNQLGSEVKSIPERSAGWLSGEPDYFGRNEISSGGDLSHYSSASLY